MPAGNGYYDPRDGSIHIDLNAGDQGSAMLSTIAHELTHFIQDWSPAKYRTFCRILIEGYADRGQSVRELIQAKQAKYRQELGIELTEEQAYDEVIASSMESVLNDGNVMDLLDQLETADKSLWEKFRSFIEEIADLIHRTIQAFRNVHPESPEGRIVEKMAQIRDQLQQAFAEGLHEGGENYRTGGQKNTADNSGVKYSYAGKTANSANVSLLEKAQQMDETGTNMEDIRQNTGWYKGKDGKWRFEIDDSKMKISKDISNYMRLGDLLKHDELFAAYPNIADLMVVFQSLPPDVLGRYDRSFGGIDISYQIKNDPEKIKGVLIHEIQHVIQHWEGFASGTSVEAWRRRLNQGYDARPARFQLQEKNAADELQKIRQENPDFYRDMMELSQMEPSVPRGAINWDTLEQIEEDPIEWQQYDTQREQLEAKYGEMAVWDFNDLMYHLQQARSAQQRTAEELYYNTAGEIEARDVSDRRTRDAAWRKNKPPVLGGEDTVFADSVSGWSDAYDAETSSIKEQLSNASEQLLTMEPVADVSVPTNLQDSRSALRWALDLLKPTGYRVERQGLGTIWFEKDDINNGLNYADNPEERAALALLPRVLKRGIEIGRHGDHKKRQKKTITFAAPAVVNGTRVNMAAVITVRNGRYYAHRIVMPNGAVFRFASEKNNDATQEPLRGVPNVGSLAKATSVASINNISRSRDDVKKYSARYQQNESAAQLLRQENDRMTEDVAALTPLVQALRKMNGGKMRKAYLAEAVFYLKKTAGARGSSTELGNLLSEFYDYVTHNDDYTWEDTFKRH